MPATGSGESPAAADMTGPGVATDPTARARELTDAATTGNRRALARLLTAVENRTPVAEAALRTLYPLAGKAHIVGITGAPGAGKSTLVAALIAEVRAAGRSVAVVAVDPSSPITGGALLGDRVRMQSYASDREVFIRSMASRGHAGGLASTSAAAAAVMDACGFDLVLLETVGTGQSEVEVAAAADTTVVLEAPEMGDEVQAIKAGLLEVADIVVVNKGDRPGAQRTASQLRAMLVAVARVGTADSRHHGNGPENASRGLGAGDGEGAGEGAGVGAGAVEGAGEGAGAGGARGGVARGGVARGGVARGGVARGGVARGGVARGGVARGGVARGGVAREPAPPRPRPKQPEVLVTTATTGDGIPELLVALNRHRQVGGGVRGTAARLARAEAQVWAILADRIRVTLDAPERREATESVLRLVADHELDPFGAVDRLLASLRSE